MSIKSRSDVLPPDAVRMDDAKATNYAWELISGWNNTSDTWALRYGASMLGGICSVSGLFVIAHYRTRLRLGPYGLFSSMLPTVCLPGAFNAFFHKQIISTDILMQKRSNCFICHEVRSAAIQLTFGVAYPMVLGPISTFMLANRFNTIRIPNFISDRKEFLEFFRKTSKSLSGLLMILSIFHIAGSSIITYFELRNSAAVTRKLYEIENKIDKQLK